MSTSPQIQRNSSIELLRIILMVLIISFHFIGDAYGLANMTTYNYSDDTLLSKLVAHGSGILAVPCFILLTGYYGLNFKVKKFINILLQCFTYSFILYWILAYFNSNFSIKIATYQFFCFQPGWWFIWCYIILYLLSPVINKLLNFPPPLFILITFTIIYIQVGFWIRTQTALTLFYILSMYVLGMGAKQYIHWNTKKLLATLILSGLCFYGMILFSYYYDKPSIMRFVCSYYNPFVTAMCIAIVMLTMKIKFTSSIINWLSNGCLAAYLLHYEHQSGLYQYLLHFFEGYARFPYHKFIIYAFLIYFGAIVIEKIRSKFMSGLLFKTSAYIETQINRYSRVETR